MNIRVSDYQDYKNTVKGLKKMETEQIIASQLSRLAKDCRSAINKCQECEAVLPDSKSEVRQGGYFEFVTDCQECGATYTD